MSERAYKPWIIVLTVLLIIASFLSGVGIEYVRRPKLVYRVTETSTVLGPTLGQEVSRLVHRQYMTAFPEALKEDALKEQFTREFEEQLDGPDVSDEERLAMLAEFLYTMQRNVMKKALAPDRLFPTKYLKVEFWNDGRKAANDIRIHVDVPGIIVESKAHSDEQRSLKAARRKVLDQTLPVGLVIEPSALPRLIPGDRITVEIWYSDVAVAEAFLAPSEQVSSEVSVMARHESGAAEEQSSRANQNELDSGFFVNLGLLLTVLILVLAGVILQISRLRRE